MAESKLQIQSVIYNNNLQNIERSITSLARAYELYKLEYGDTRPFVIKYGDASNVRVLSDEYLISLREKYKFHFDIQYVFFHENTGTAKGHNILASNCETEYMMVMNPDIIVCPRLFIEMFKPFETSELTGLVEARQTPIEHPKEYDIKNGETSWATTACALFTTEIFRELHGFDEESFFMYCDDVDFSWRIRLLGKKIIYQPLAVVFHAKRLSAKASWQPTSAEIYYSAVAAMMMAYKWSNPKHLDRLISVFSSSSDEIYKRAVKEFIRKKEENKLPAPLDPKHKVATFVGNNYTEHRFIL